MPAGINSHIGYVAGLPDRARRHRGHLPAANIRRRIEKMPANQGRELGAGSVAVGIERAAESLAGIVGKGEVVNHGAFDRTQTTAAGATGLIPAGI